MKRQVKTYRDFVNEDINTDDYGKVESRQGEILNTLYNSLRDALKSGLIDDSQYESTLDLLNMEKPYNNGKEPNTRDSLEDLMRKLLELEPGSREYRQLQSFMVHKMKEEDPNYEYRKSFPELKSKIMKEKNRF